eukprot:jgi/Galph1/2885/GphlegSOOS_G1557.1
MRKPRDSKSIVQPLVGTSSEDMPEESDIEISADKTPTIEEYENYCRFEMMSPKSASLSGRFLPEGKERRSAILNIVFAGIALTSDGYCESVVNLINVFFAKLYPREFTSAMSTRISNALLVGAIIGQLGFGLMSDRIGRKVGLLCTTGFVIVGSLLCSAAYGANGSVKGLLWSLVVYRGIVGVGVGGEYHVPQRMPVKQLKKQFHVQEVNQCGECSFGLAIVPILSVFYFRIRMLNSKLYRKEAMKRKVPYLLVLKNIYLVLVEHGFSMILLPLAMVYFSSTILENVVSGTDIMKTAYYQLILSALGIPGLVIGAATIDKIGRKKQQFIGFLGYGVLGVLIGALFGKLRHYTAALIILYGVFNSFGNFGPGDALGLVSSEIYPTAVRGTCYGISAAFGKTGGAIGTQIFLPIRNAFGGASSTNGNRAVFIVSGGVALLGALLSLLLIPDYSKRCLTKEDEEFHQYLLLNEVDASFGEAAEASAPSNML